MSDNARVLLCKKAAHKITTQAKIISCVTHQSHQHQILTLHCVRDLFFHLYVCAISHFGRGGRAVQHLCIMLGLTNHSWKLVDRSARQGRCRHGDW